MTVRIEPLEHDAQLVAFEVVCEAMQPDRYRAQSPRRGEPGALQNEKPRRSKGEAVRVGVTHLHGLLTQEPVANEPVEREGDGARVIADDHRHLSGGERVMATQRCEGVEKPGRPSTEERILKHIDGKGVLS